MADISNDLSIRAYLHCGMCLDELPNGTSAREFAALECGWTREGFQIWCKRHECNVMHIDFEGVQHPANTTRKL